MIKKFYILVVLLFTLKSFTNAQCDLNQTSKPEIQLVTITPATCPSNGVIQLQVNPATGGGTFVYEIISGPILRLIQSQSSLTSLPAGNYTVRITGCNGEIKDSNITVPPEYTSIEKISYAQESSEPMFRCGNVDGKVYLNIKSFIADTSFVRWPIHYQITDVMDPIYGFVGKPSVNITKLTSPDGNEGFIQLAHDSITNLSYGDYLIRFIDACDNICVRSVHLGQPDPPTAYEFDFKPHNHTHMDTTYNGAICKYWWYVNIVDSITGMPIDNNINHPENDINGPWHITIRNALTNSIIYQLEKSQSDTSFGFVPQINSEYRLDYDIPYVFEVTNRCGYMKTYSFPAYHKVTPTIGIGEYCNVDGFYLNTYQTHAPIIFKQINIHTYQTVKMDTLVEWGRHYVGEPLNDTFRYIVYDACGLVDSIDYADTIYVDNGTYISPVWVDTSFYNPITCGNNTMNLRIKLNDFAGYYGEALDYNYFDFEHYDKRPFYHPYQGGYYSLLKGAYLLSGPANSGPYPKYLRYAPWMPDDPNPYFNIYGADSVEAGVYQVVFQYGCNLYDTTSITIAQASPTTYSETHNYSVTIDPCFGASMNSSVTTTGIQPKTYPIIQSGPQEYINNIQQLFLRWQNIATAYGYNTLEMVYPTTYPISFYYRSYYNYQPDYNLDSSFKLVVANPITLDTVDVANTGSFTFDQLFNYNNTLPMGSYTLQWFTNDFCTNQLTETNIVTMPDYKSPYLTLGSTSAYLCQGKAGQPYLFLFPDGGKAPYLYQIKNKDSINSDYSPLQSDSILALPSGTPIGTKFLLRVFDSCGTASTGEVTLNSFDGEFYLPNVTVCEKDSAMLKTAFVPYSIYTWTGPNPPYGSINNILKIPSVDIADTGTYNLQINVLDGCYLKSAEGSIHDKVCFPLSMNDISLHASLNNDKTIRLNWNTSIENISLYELEKSTNGIQFNSVYSSSDATSYLDKSIFAGNTYYYRIKAFDLNGKTVYSNIEKVYLKPDESQITFYPNPATTNSIYFTYEGKMIDQAELTIYDYLGKQVIKQTQELKRNNEVHIEKLIPGIYQFKIIIDDEVFTGKFQKL